MKTARAAYNAWRKEKELVLWTMSRKRLPSVDKLREMKQRTFEIALAFEEAALREHLVGINADAYTDALYARGRERSFLSARERHELGEFSP